MTSTSGLIARARSRKGGRTRREGQSACSGQSRVSRRVASRSRDRELTRPWLRTTDMTTTRCAFPSLHTISTLLAHASLFLAATVRMDPRRVHDVVSVARRRVRRSSPSPRSLHLPSDPRLTRSSLRPPIRYGYTAHPTLLGAPTSPSPTPPTPSSTHATNACLFRLSPVPSRRTSR